MWVHRHTPRLIFEHKVPITQFMPEIAHPLGWRQMSEYHQLSVDALQSTVNPIGPVPTL
jgi:hypothetical protein